MVLSGREPRTVMVNEQPPNVGQMEEVSTSIVALPQSRGRSVHAPGWRAGLNRSAAMICERFDLIRRADRLILGIGNLRCGSLVFASGLIDQAAVSVSGSATAVVTRPGSVWRPAARAARRPHDGAVSRRSTFHQGAHRGRGRAGQSGRDPGVPLRGHATVLVTDAATARGILKATERRASSIATDPWRSATNREDSS